jgi:hypothetical protein
MSRVRGRPPARLYAMARKTPKTRRQAAEILDRIAETLPMPAVIASFLRGYANGLRAR